MVFVQFPLIVNVLGYDWPANWKQLLFPFTEPLVQSEFHKGLNFIQNNVYM